MPNFSIISILSKDNFLSAIGNLSMPETFNKRNSLKWPFCWCLQNAQFQTKQKYNFFFSQFIWKLLLYIFIQISFRETIQKEHFLRPQCVKRSTTKRIILIAIDLPLTNGIQNLILARHQRLRPLEWVFHIHCETLGETEVGWHIKITIKSKLVCLVCHSYICVCI